MRSVRSTLGATAVAVLAAGAALASATPASAASHTSTGAVGAVSVEVTYSDDEVSPGDVVTAQITFTNTGTGPARFTRYDMGDKTVSVDDVYLLDTCDVGGLDATCEQTSAGDIFRVDVNGLPVGQSVVHATLQVKDDAEVGEHTFDQLLRGSETSVDLAPPYTVTVIGSDADVAIDLAASAGPLLTSQITYTLAVTNEGPAATTATTVETQLPHSVYAVTDRSAGCTYSTTTDVVTCDAGAVADGATTTLSFRANIGLLALGPLNATATRTSSSPTDPDATNDSDGASCHVLTSLLISCPVEPAEPE